MYIRGFDFINRQHLDACCAVKDFFYFTFVVVDTLHL